MKQKKRPCGIFPLLYLAIAGCGAGQPETGGVWAVNVGGGEYTGVDGTAYSADAGVSGGEPGWQDKVLGSQDEYIYQSYREGAIEVAHPIENGVYDLTFKFTEPRDYNKGDRLFDVFAEGRRIIDDMDVLLARDGKVRSALSVTVPDIEIADGEMNVDFEASAAEPILNALIVRPKAAKTTSAKLIWSDEFDYDGEPDPEKWSIDVWPAGKVNEEDQAYTARPRNLRVDGGKLIIEAFKEDYEGASYTSARVHSSGKGDFLYGRVEVRAKLPEGMGTWPAIWMLPSDPYRYATSCKPGDEWQGSSTCDAWPNSGEIDIMEHVGYEMNHVHGTVHNKAYYWVNWEQRKARILVDGVAEAFHTYALEWTPEQIQIFMDDSLYFTYINEDSGWESWPFDQPFHVILNLAVGGMWGRAGGGIDAEIFPQKFVVDYVRVYEFESAKR